MRNRIFAPALDAMLILASLLFAAPAFAETPAATPAPSAAPAAPTPPPPAEDTLKTLDIAPRPALVLHAQATWEEGYAKIHDSLAKLRAAAQKAGLKTVDQPLAAFTDTDEAGFKFDALLPVEADANAKPALDAGIVLGQTPGGKAIKFAHTGAYDDIDSTYDAVTNYLDEKGLEATNVYLEDYRVEGKDSGDQALRIDIYVFLK